jgi:mono/diheme cytochrome c family protein
MKTSITALGIAAGLVLFAPGLALADAAAGKTAFEANKCTDCHYTQGPAREKTIDDQLAKKGPELWYAGSKFQQKWLGAWLQDPKPIRPLKYNSLNEKNPGDHPKLSGGDAKNVTSFLMSLTSDAVTDVKIKAKKGGKGKLIFTKKMPCSGCHQYATRKKGVKGGLSGPSLVGAASRLNMPWVYAYLTKPKVFKPVKMMPVFAGVLSDKDLIKVNRFVASFK